MRRVQTRPHIFVGNNFMTPNIVGYWKLARGYAELSTGTGIYNQPIYGVTVRPEDGRSKLFDSSVAAMDYIKEMS